MSPLSPASKQFPCDTDGKPFPCSILNVKKLNGELTPRRWLVFSAMKNALFCLPCRLFSYTVQHPSQSTLASTSGWGTENKWRKLFHRLPEHEQSVAHKKCYISWRELERRIAADAGISDLLDKSILSEANKWKMLLTKILNVIVFLGERGLASRGTSQRIGDVHNGNFLGLLELLANYDPLLQEHVIKVKLSQQRNERLQAHYLCAD